MLIQSPIRVIVWLCRVAAHLHEPLGVCESLDKCLTQESNLLIEGVLLINSNNLLLSL